MSHLRVVLSLVLLCGLAGCASDSVESRRTTLGGGTADVIIVDAAIGATSASPGQVIAASCAVANTGSEASERNQLRYYLSADNTLDGADRYLNYDSVSELGAGEESQETANLRVPADVAESDYFILFVADYKDAVPERDESDNVVALPLRVGVPGGSGSEPELTVTGATATGSTVASVEPGERVLIHASVTNLGGVEASPSQLRYYLSDDPVHDEGDRYLSYDGVDALLPGGTSQEQSNPTIHATTAPGRYFVLLVADYRGEVSEADESNNTHALPLIVGAVETRADLRVVDAHVLEAEAGQRDSITVDARVVNEGGDSLTVSKLKYFYSVDAVLDASDITLSYDQVDGLAGGTSSLEMARVSIPPSATAGERFILFVADAMHVVEESDESNNVVAVPIRINNDAPEADLPDLRFVASGTSAAGAEAGARLDVSVTVINAGPRPAATSRLKYFLSTDERYDPSDLYLNYDRVDPLEPGVSAIEGATVRVPLTTVDGTHHILVVLDETEEVAETFESNNVVALPITVGPGAGGAVGGTPGGPDLSVSSIDTFGFAPRPGQRFDIEVTVENRGASAAGPTRVKYYLSRDPVVGGGDVYVGYDLVDALAPGASSVETARPRAPSAALDGLWHLLAVADANDEAAEAVEDNNVATLPLLIDVDSDIAAADLSATGIALDTATLAPTGEVLLSATISNTGRADAGPSFARFYLSTDEIYDPRGVERFLGRVQVGALPVGASHALAAHLRLPHHTALGAYHLIAVLDRDDEVLESVESNNIFELPITVSSSGRTAAPYPYVCPSTINHHARLEGLHTVATLNALHLGWSNSKDMVALACVVSHFDVVGLVEVDAESGLIDLVTELERLTGQGWSHHISEREVGDEHGREFYGYVWRDAAARLTGVVGFYPDPDDAIKREPYAVNFRMGNFDFTLAVFHLQFGTSISVRRSEAAYVDDIYDYFQAANGSEDDLLFGGDMNLPSDDAAFTLMARSSMSCVTDPEAKTTIGIAGLTSSFDNIFYSSDSLRELTEEGVFDYTRSNFSYLEEFLSDHVPVYIAVDTSMVDDD